MLLHFALHTSKFLVFGDCAFLPSFQRQNIDHFSSSKFRVGEKAKVRPFAGFYATFWLQVFGKMFHQLPFRTLVGNVKIYFQSRFQRWSDSAKMFTIVLESTYLSIGISCPMTTSVKDLATYRKSNWKIMRKVLLPSLFVQEASHKSFSNIWYSLCLIRLPWLVKIKLGILIYCDSKEIDCEERQLNASEVRWE